MPKISLTPKESSRYSICKKTVSDGIQNFFDVGTALKEIRDARLYREEFDSFDAFCRSTFQMTKTHAYRMIQAAEIKVSPIGDSITNEAQARAIAQVPEEDRSEVLKIAEKSGDLTAAAITEAAEKVEPYKPAKKTKEDEIILDKEGWPIPHRAQAAWQRAETESKVAMTVISKLRATLKEAEESKDVIWREFRFQENVSHLTAVFNNFKQVVPHGVCTSCQGKLPDKCAECKGRGFVSGLAYQMYSNSEVKTMREKIKAKKGGN